MLFYKVGAMLFYKAGARVCVIEWRSAEWQKVAEEHTKQVVIKYHRPNLLT